MTRLTILGSTGSIGRQALEVVDRAPGEFEIVALGARRNTDALEQQARRYRPKVVAVTDENGHRREMRYDLGGRVVAEIDPNGEETRLAYDAAGRLVSRTDPLGNVTTFRVDAVGNRVGRTDPNANAARIVAESTSAADGGGTLIVRFWGILPAIC